MCEQRIKNPVAFRNTKSNLENMLEEKYADLKKCGVLYFELNHLDDSADEHALEVRTQMFARATEIMNRFRNDEVDIYSCGIDGFLVIGINYSKAQIWSFVQNWIDEWESYPEYEEFRNLLSVGIAWDSAPISLKSMMVRAIEEMLNNRKLIEAGIPLDDCIRGEVSSYFGLLTATQFFKTVNYRLKSSSEDYCIIAIDIEHFKLFNKWHGRSAGDELLASMARILKEFEKKYKGIVAYLGGDNFAIILPDRKEVIDLLENMLVEVAMSRGKTAGFLPAFGVFCIDNRDMEAVEMYDYAVEALSRAKGRYEKRLCYYDNNMTSDMKKEIDIIVAAREALRNEEFTIYLQPQVRINRSQVVGAEALVRWISPEKGVVSPAEFIPALEKNGFIGEVDQYVWELVCKTIRSWIDRGIKPVPVSINISRIDILSFDVIKFLDGLVEKYGIERKYLKIEITESAYADDSGKILETIKELRKSGYTLMMDDFGSGYSSLNMLREVIVDIIKLDMRFLDLDTDNVQKGISILKSVIDMSNEISIPIVIEGVETSQQADFLQDMGVRFAQGYLYYRPMPSEQFEQLISQEDNVDGRGIYSKNIDIANFNKAIEKMLKNRNERYKKIGITKTRGGFFEYEALGEHKLRGVSQSVAYMFGCDTVEEFREYVGDSFIGMVHPDDRERVEVEINSQIFSSEWNMDYIEYRILRKDGKVRYVYDYGHLEEKKEEGQDFFYVFLLDVTDRIQ